MFGQQLIQLSDEFGEFFGGLFLVVPVPKGSASPRVRRASCHHPHSRHHTPDCFPRNRICRAWISARPGPTCFSLQRSRRGRNKFDDLVLKMRVRRVVEHATVKADRSSAGPKRRRIREAVANDNQGMHEQQVSSLRTLCLYRGHALRSLPLRSEWRQEEYRRCWVGPRDRF
jgi:hypothetical protein